MSTIEIAKKVEFMELGELAEGSIHAGEHQQERLEEITNRVGSGEFHVVTDETLPCGCIDGRIGCSMKPNTAGGTESLMVADDLINKQFQANDGSTAGAYDNVVRFLKKFNKRFGGHDGSHADDEKTDCGANDKLALIYAAIVKKADTVRGIVEATGLTVDDETHDLIIKNATQRADFSPGHDLLEILNRETQDDSDNEVDHLRGSHQEVVAVINKRVGTTLDRDALEAEFGPEYEAFNVDAWAFHNGAQVVSLGERETQQKEVAMAYYNIATSLVLCGPKMRVVILE